MKYNGPKVKISRKLGLELTPKARKVTQKKNYGPGQHGPSRRRSKQSDYGRQLLEKQRLRLQYNISEKQMSNYYKKASKLVGNTGDLLIQLMESRLDAFVYRAGFATTIYAARQYVSHGHFNVNGRRVNIPSYSLKPNDLVGVREKSKKHIGIQESIRNAGAPTYIELSKADFNARYLNVPEREDIPVICEIPLVVEYYSR